MPSSGPACERCRKNEGVQTITLERVDYRPGRDGAMEAKGTYRDYLTLCEACYVELYLARSRWIETRSRRADGVWEVLRLWDGEWRVCQCKSCGGSTVAEHLTDVAH